MLDAERQIRFLYPPVFFVASLFLGIRLDHDVAIVDVWQRLIGEDAVQDFLHHCLDADVSVEPPVVELAGALPI